jgi:signal transduction histidine kinase
MSSPRGKEEGGRRKEEKDRSASSFILHPSSFWTVVVVLLLLCALVAVALYEPVTAWLASEDKYDRETLVEWLEETRGFRETLPEMVESYLKRQQELEESGKGEPAPKGGLTADAELERVKSQWKVVLKQEEIYEHLGALANPPTKMFPGQLPLFPIIYRLEIRFDQDRYPPIIWDSELPYRPYQGVAAGKQPSPQSTPRQDETTQIGQYKVLRHPLQSGATIVLIYQLHAYKMQQRIESEQKRRLHQAAILIGVAVVLAVSWLVVMQRRERERERQEALARREVDEAQRRQEETERKLLEQRLAANAAEQRVLELRSQLYASISIMAGSYAHNIKNLLVRPNDLLQRCLEADSLSPDQSVMLHEVRQTLGTVTERLQQILRTVRRDPTRTEQTRLDLNALLRETEHTWKELARDKWKVELTLDLAEGELLLEGDVSHLQQTIENLLFNARDAIFEMRNSLRTQARADQSLPAAARKQAVIAAAAWKGRVCLRSRAGVAGQGDVIVLEVIDNGAGMTEEVRRRCTETHFTTKRDNALYVGHSTGMGLGLAFVVAILEHHRAALEIESTPWQGTTFRIRFPAASGSHAPVAGEAG